MFIKNVVFGSLLCLYLYINILSVFAGEEAGQGTEGRKLLLLPLFMFFDQLLLPLFMFFFLIIYVCFFFSLLFFILCDLDLMYNPVVNCGFVGLLGISFRMMF